MISDHSHQELSLSSNLQGGAESLILRGRDQELQVIAGAIDCDHDLLIAGPPGSGRRFLLEVAARHKARQPSLSLDIDCIRASDKGSFIQLLCSSINSSALLKEPDLYQRLREWLSQKQDTCFSLSSQARQLNIDPEEILKDLDVALDCALELIQECAQLSERRVLVVFRNFTHIHAWTSDEAWELRLRLRLKELPAVLYVLIGTIGELEDDRHRLSSSSKDPEVEELRCAVQESYDSLILGPLKNEFVMGFIDLALSQAGFGLNPLDASLKTFLEVVDGSFSDAVTLINRIILEYSKDEQSTNLRLVNVQDINGAISSLLQEQKAMCESILLMLPSKQAQLLTCLAVDPTSKPQSRDYLERHNLFKGGAVQGALRGLKKKGLIYRDSEENYKLTIPLLRLWIQQRHTRSLAVDNRM